MALRGRKALVVGASPGVGMATARLPAGGGAETALAARTQQVLDDALQRIPLGRFATADEAAKAIVFLAVEAGFATGAAWRLDGGTTAGA